MSDKLYKFLVRALTFTDFFVIIIKVVFGEVSELAEGARLEIV